MRKREREIEKERERESDREIEWGRESAKLLRQSVSHYSNQKMLKGSSSITVEEYSPGAVAWSCVLSSGETGFESREEKE